jgi:hypothetical protein
MKKKEKSAAATTIALALVHGGGAFQGDTEEEAEEVGGENSSFENRRHKEISCRDSNPFAMDPFERIGDGDRVPADFIDHPNYIERDRLGEQQGQIIIVILPSQESPLRFEIWRRQCGNLFLDQEMMVLPENWPETCHSANDPQIFHPEKRCANLPLVPESQEETWEDLHLVVILRLAPEAQIFQVEEGHPEILSVISHSDLHGEILLAYLRGMSPEMARSHPEL